MAVGAAAQAKKDLTPVAKLRACNRNTAACGASYVREVAAGRLVDALPVMNERGSPMRGLR